MTDPVRPPEPAPPARFDLNRPTIIAILYLAAFVLPLTALVGFVLALVWRGETGAAWEASHFEWHARSFAIGLAASILGVILALVLIGYLVLIAVALWWAARAIVALARAQRLEPIPQPRSWTI